MIDSSAKGGGETAIAVNLCGRGGRPTELLRH